MPDEVVEVSDIAAVEHDAASTKSSSSEGTDLENEEVFWRLPCPAEKGTICTLESYRAQA
jgi:hypothetical protein